MGSLCSWLFGILRAFFSLSLSLSLLLSRSSFASSFALFFPSLRAIFVRWTVVICELFDFFVSVLVAFDASRRSLCFLSQGEQTVLTFHLLRSGQEEYEVRTRIYPPLLVN